MPNPTSDCILVSHKVTVVNSNSLLVIEWKKWWSNLVKNMLYVDEPYFWERGGLTYSEECVIYWPTSEEDESFE